MKDLVFLGIQGCGKGTQADLILPALGNFVYLEMGQIFRAVMSNDNVIGNFVRDIVDSGSLVDHFVTHDRLHTTLQIAKKKGAGILMDGFPRAMEQAEFMVNDMQTFGRDFVVVHFELSKEKAMERMIKRAKIEGREDDTPAAMEVRIHSFLTETMPVIEHFEKLGKVITINADDTVENIHAELKQKLGL